MGVFDKNTALVSLYVVQEGDLWKRNYGERPVAAVAGAAVGNDDVVSNLASFGHLLTRAAALLITMSPKGGLMAIG